jgi:hypothetical protein
LEFCFYNSLKDELIVLVIYEGEIDQETFKYFFDEIIYQFNTQQLFIEDNKNKNFFTRKKIKKFEEIMLEKMVKNKT